jgi:hypothetical protein
MVPVLVEHMSLLVAMVPALNAVVIGQPNAVQNHPAIGA